MSTPARPSIIIDCDPGHDDAIAIVVAACHTDVVGITTVNGNAPLSATTRNAIMLLSHYERRVQHEGQAWNLATAIRGASERLVPILMTALTAALGLVPLAIAAGKPGSELLAPLAIIENEFPEQIEPLFTVTIGVVFTVTFEATLFEIQPNVLEPIIE